MEKTDAITMQRAFEAALEAQSARRRAALRKFLRPVAVCLIVLLGVAVFLAAYGLSAGWRDAAQESREARWRAGIDRPNGRSVADMQAAR